MAFFTKKRKNLVKYYKSELEIFDLEKLKINFNNIYERYHHLSKLKIDQLGDNLDYINVNLFLLLTNQIQEADSIIKKHHIYSKHLNELFKTIKADHFKYKYFYLNLLFEINEINLNDEIKELLLREVKIFFGDLNDYLNKQYFLKEIKDSYFRNILTKIEDAILALEDSNQINQDIIYFKNKAKNVVRTINNAFFIIDELEKGFTFLNKSIPKFDQEFKGLLLQNSDSLLSLVEGWKKEIKALKFSIKNLKENLNKANLEKASFIEKEITNKIKKIFKELSRNANANQFNLNSEKYLTKIQKQMKNDYILLENDINKYLINKRKSIFKDLTKHFKIVNTSFESYQLLTREGFRYKTPLDLYFAIKELLRKYKDFSLFTSDILLQIENVITKSNDINRVLSKINTILLNSESKIKDLSDSMKLLKEEQLQNYEIKISGFIDKYHQSYQIADDKDQRDLNRFYKEVLNFDREIVSYSFLYNYIEWLILCLNKYRSDTEIDLLVKNIEDNFLKGDFAESLRIGSKVVNIYNIYG